MSYWSGRQYIGVGPGDLLSTLQAVIDEILRMRGEVECFLCDRSSRSVCPSGGGRRRSGGPDPDSGA